jgi:hypothetical protein
MVNIAHTSLWFPAVGVAALLKLFNTGSGHSIKADWRFQHLFPYIVSEVGFLQ